MAVGCEKEERIISVEYLLPMYAVPDGLNEEQRTSKQAYRLCKEHIDA